MILPFVVTTLLIAIFIYVNAESCSAYNGSQGNCVKIFNCPPLIQLIKNPTKSAEDSRLLRESICGFEETIPKVCCPNFYTSEDQSKYVQEENCNSCAGCEKKSCAESNDGTNCSLPPNQNSWPNCGNIVSCYLRDPLSKCCGRHSSSRNTPIIAPQPQLDDHPWLALIEYQSDNGTETLCGGVLISGKYVLSPAHCLTGMVLKLGTPKSVRLGEYDTSTERTCVGELNHKVCMNANDTISIAIEQIKVHPEYNPQTRKNDIALIRLKDLAPYTAFIRPICLPKSDYTQYSPPIGRLTDVGWNFQRISDKNKSKISRKHIAHPPLVKLEDCQKIYKTQSNLTLWNKQLCAGGEPSRDTCSGFSGGNLVYENQEHFEVVALNSFGFVCGADHIPGVYTKVFEYNYWIHRSIKAYKHIEYSISTKS